MIKLRETIMILDLHRQGLSVSAIARQTGIDRKTVRKYIERGLEAPTYGPRKPRATVVDPFATYLRERVKAYPGLTGSRLFREIKERGYTGGYTAVTDFLRDVRPPAVQGFEVRFETPPGEQAQVDFAQFHVVFTDEPMTPRIVWLFSMVLGHSRLIWARFVMHQNLPTVLRCHVAAFEAIGGVPREILYDRMKTAVVGEGQTEGIVYNRALVDLARHYGFHPKACRPYRAKTKGKVERPFRYIREDFFLARTFRNLDDLNAQLRHWLDTIANPRVHATTLRVVSKAFAEERPHLRPLPLAPFRAVLKLERRISREGMVSVGGNAYSVPDATRSRLVEVHSLANELRIFENGTLIAVHPVLEGRKQRRVHPDHRKGMATIQRSWSKGDSAVTLQGAGDKVMQRSLAFYDAVGKAMARENRP
ncbi:MULTISPECIES: IS21 family transposase [unclassified Shinella]|uniref:IS21 family transposase n=1 Tax=unclassified Shinella TaxID=2643062 RepID=UPI00225C45FE|nr:MULTISPECIES: IS21 family transposase [unclassified Shinella]MCO5153709.1 IS21 family transposase [Shinella sp.]MDC7259964.1 IS21 family transposase [Shinella sp. YE25]CAI0341664.1 transposase [Rhizobiaceae bacterium]CAK7261977.1 transposase [Shinella sp. WSC3-e]